VVNDDSRRIKQSPTDGNKLLAPDSNRVSNNYDSPERRLAVNDKRHASAVNY
jgi:hypothetical protein